LIRRIERAALGTSDQETVDLPLFGVHQHGVARAARMSTVCELALRAGGAPTKCCVPGVATNFNAIRGCSWRLMMLSPQAGVQVLSVAKA
jgi:hypothetical protein